VEIHISRGEDQSGPFTLKQVQDCLAQGSLLPDDLAYHEGLENWILLFELVDSIEQPEPTAPALSTKRKFLIGIGTILALLALLAIAGLILDMLDEARRNERVLWEFKKDSYGIGAPSTIGADGTVYVGGDKLYALDGKTGDIVWQFNRKTAQRTAPAIDSKGILFIAGQSGNFFALDSKNGKIKWEIKLNGHASSPAISPNGTVFIGLDGNRVIALDGSDGSIKWEFRGGKKAIEFEDDIYGYRPSSPALGTDGSVYVGFGDKKIYALNGETGTKIWEFTTKNKVAATPVVGKDGSVVVGSMDNNVYALNEKTGEKIWAFDTGDDVFWAAAIGNDGTVYVGSRNRIFFALDGETGAKKWEYKMEKDHREDSTSPRWSPPVIGADGTVYVGTGHRGFEVFTLDGKTGAKNGSFMRKVGEHHSPPLANRGLFMSVQAVGFML